MSDVESVTFFVAGAEFLGVVIDSTNNVWSETDMLTLDSDFEAVVMDETSSILDEDGGLNGLCDNVAEGLSAGTQVSDGSITELIASNAITEAGTARLAFCVSAKKMGSEYFGSSVAI